MQTTKVTAEQMRNQISCVRDCMNSVKGCCNTDNKVQEKKFLANAIAELEAMVLSRKNPELTARQESWLAEARELLATSSDVAQVLPSPPTEVLALVRSLSGRA